MVKVLRKVIGKRVNCPKCGRELSFDDSDEKYSFSFSIPRFDESTSICCPCGNQVLTRDKYGNIAKNVTLITVDVNEEAENGKDQEK